MSWQRQAEADREADREADIEADREAGRGRQRQKLKHLASPSHKPCRKQTISEPCRIHN